MRSFTGYLTGIKTAPGSGLATLFLRSELAAEDSTPDTFTQCYCEAGHGLRVLDGVLGFSRDLKAATSRLMVWQIDDLNLLQTVEEAEKMLALPTIHLNGTSREALFTANREAAEAVRTALEKLKGTMPHGRDYYTQPLGPGGQALYLARAEYRARYDALQRVLDELEEIGAAILDAPGPGRHALQRVTTEEGERGTLEFHGPVPPEFGGPPKGG